MPVTVFSFGVFQTKVGTTHIVMLTTTPGVFQLKTYIGSMISGDNLVLRVRTGAHSGFTTGIEFQETFVGTQNPEVLRTSIPVTTVTTAEYTMNCTSSGAGSSGTGSNGPPVEWALLGIN